MSTPVKARGFPVVEPLPLPPPGIGGATTAAAVVALSHGAGPRVVKLTEAMFVTEERIDGTGASHARAGVTAHP
jgi:hypothetical protein